MDSDKEQTSEVGPFGEVLHLSFEPASANWIGDLQSKAANSTCHEIRERYKRWGPSGLGELALAVATRLAIVRRAETHLDNFVRLLKVEIRESGEIDRLLANDAVYCPKNQELLFDICQAVDSCIFESRSLYEVLGKFARRFGSAILGIKVTESQLNEAARAAEVPLRWIDPLREDRKHFFHQSAPWIAFHVVSRDPVQLRLLIMRENLHSFDDRTKFIVEKDLAEISRGLMKAIDIVREWLKDQLLRLEKEQGHAQ